MRRGGEKEAGRPGANERDGYNSDERIGIPCAEPGAHPGLKDMGYFIAQKKYLNE